MTNPYKTAAAFAMDFVRMEYALKRSEFIQKGKTVAEPDWHLFASRLGDTFFDEIVASGIATTLIGHPPRRLLAELEWAPENPPPCRM